MNPKFKIKIPKTKEYPILIIFIHFQKFENPQNRLNLHHYQIFFRPRVFDYTEVWRDRALRSSGNHQPIIWKGANTRPETEL